MLGHSPFAARESRRKMSQTIIYNANHKSDTVPYTFADVHVYGYAAAKTEAYTN